MSTVNGVWHDAKIDPPGTNEINKPVLVVREFIQSKNYKYRKIDFAIYSASVMRAPSCTWEGKWNKSGVILWIPLPEVPEVDA